MIHFLRHSIPWQNSDNHHDLSVCAEVVIMVIVTMVTRQSAQVDPTCALLVNFKYSIWMCHSSPVSIVMGHSKERGCIKTSHSVRRVQFSSSHCDSQFVSSFCKYRLYLYSHIVSDDESGTNGLDDALNLPTKRLLDCPNHARLHTRMRETYYTGTLMSYNAPHTHSLFAKEE